MSISLIKRAIYIGQIEGWMSVVKKTYIYLLSKSVACLGRFLFSVNSAEYWNFRMKWDWTAVGGSAQTQLFAISLFANVDWPRFRNVKTILDYGCATGDSAVVFRTFLPEVKIYFHDISPLGVKKAVSKYSRFFSVEEWTPGQKVDLVYCSNVIEHVDNPRALVKNLIDSSNKYVVIQCPWDEHHPLNGKRLSPDNQAHEHIWTIDNVFFEEFMTDERISWTLSKGKVPLAWEGGIQAFFFGELKQ